MLDAVTTPTLTKLIYHPVLGTSTVSPFDQAILRVARNGRVRMVSPYIGVTYLERLISITGEWHLISDVEEWLRALSIRARPRAWQFIRSNLERIHHYPELHAKAVIGSQAAVIGSANLTEPGILNRTELAVLIEDRLLLAELGNWFDDLWSATASPLVHEGDEFVQWLDREADKSPIGRAEFAISSVARKIRASLVELPAAQALPSSPEAQLDLSLTAKGIIAAEHVHYESLVEATEAAMARRLTDGFALRNVVDDVRRSFESATVRDVYFVLLRHCANHVRSVFAEDTENQLILTGGRFALSSHESVHKALGHYDHFLASVVRSLRFDSALELSEVAIENETMVEPKDQVILIGQLLDSQFLELVDLPGEVPSYRLKSNFQWSGRYALFPRALDAWMALREQLAAMTNALPDEENGLDEGGATPDRDDVFGSALANIWMERAKRETAKRERKITDSVCAQLLERVLAGETIEGYDATDFRNFVDHGGALKVITRILEQDPKYPVVLRVAVDRSNGARRLELNAALKWDDLIRAAVARPSSGGFICPRPVTVRPLPPSPSAMAR